jgi:CDP-6-deoxy-D-xylo-4-hexulose-3-dehydrase
MLRSHGMVREADDDAVRAGWQQAHRDLNPDFIFAFPAYNVRSTEISGILGLSQLPRLDANVKLRTRNLRRFLDRVDGKRYRTDFKLEGSSNYAFNLILNEADMELTQRLMATLRESGVEFRRGSAGGGNQLRQPYLRAIVPEGSWEQFPVTDHIHFHGFYIGNFPDLSEAEVDEICRIVNSV